MSTHEDLAVPYHQQDTDYYCGAACAQMVLAQIQAGLLDQGALYTDNHNHSLIEIGWATAPDGLQWTMNNRRPPGCASSFAFFGLLSEDAISRKLIWTISHYKVAPIALVYGSDHWVVVRGYDADATPTASDDTSYSIVAFDINNPWPPVPTASPPSPLPPPHGPKDGCGTGGNRGICDEHITYAFWQSTYMTGVPSGYWKGQFVAVCDRDPPPSHLGTAPSPVERLGGDQVITAEEAGSNAQAGFEKYGLFDRDPWKTRLRRTKPAKAFLVQQLDRIDSFYYIVAMQAGRTGTPVLACVDARFGDYLEAGAVTDSGAHMFAGIKFDSVAAVQSLIGKPIDFGEPEGRLIVRKEAHSVYPVLVWKPCRESYSPFYPFHMVTVGDKQLFIRIDGQIFTSLHDQQLGL